MTDSSSHHQQLQEIFLKVTGTDVCIETQEQTVDSDRNVDADGANEVQVPLISFSADLRDPDDGTTSSGSLVVPREYAEQARARRGGEMIVRTERVRTDGTVARSRVQLEAPIDRVQEAMKPRSGECRIASGYSSKATENYMGEPIRASNENINEDGDVESRPEFTDALPGDIADFGEELRRIKEMIWRDG